MKPPTAHEPTVEEIQREAYFLYLASGRAPGRELDNWLAAKELLRHRAASAGHAAKAAHPLHFPIRTDTGHPFAHEPVPAAEPPRHHP